MIEILKMAGLLGVALAIIVLPQIIQWVEEHYNRNKWEQ